MQPKLLPFLLLATLSACVSNPRASVPSTTHASSPPAPSPRLEQHQWLEQFVGEWETEARMAAEPGAQPMLMKGHESVHSLGGLWIVSELECESPMGPMQGLLTVGYDEGRKRYVGTWIDSMMNHLWRYEGSVDAAGKVLTLEAEGPSFTGDGKMAKYKDVYEIKSRDRKTLTSWMQGPDGIWTNFMTAEYRRVK